MPKFAALCCGEERVMRCHLPRFEEPCATDLSVTRGEHERWFRR